MALLAYNEAKIDTRKRNLAGYILFCASTFLLVVVSISNCLVLFLCSWRAAIHLLLLATCAVGFSHIRTGRDSALYWHMCHCGCFWSCRCTCSRWNGWRSLLYVSWIHPSKTRFSYANDLILGFSSYHPYESSRHKPCSPS